MTFAPNIPKNAQGWYIFPDDVSYRKSLFPKVVMKHLAKMHLHLEKAIIEYVSEPGEDILDPMTGTGTVLVATLMCRNVIGIEIEEFYHNIEQEVWANFQKHPDISGNAILLHGNCKLMLPIPCDHVVFSPPYSTAFKPAKKVSGFVKDKYRVEDGEYQTYAKTTGNVGLYNTFLYSRDMEKVYNLLYKSVRSGGTMTTVTKDIIENGQRILLTKWTQRVCEQAGFRLKDWFKHKIGGGPYQDMRRAKGLETVDDEDIMIYIKEE